MIFLGEIYINSTTITVCKQQKNVYNHNHSYQIYLQLLFFAFGITIFKTGILNHFLLFFMVLIIISCCRDDVDTYITYNFIQVYFAAY